MKASWSRSALICAQTPLTNPARGSAGRAPAQRAAAERRAARGALYSG
jgi:hypothetical protein